MKVTRTPGVVDSFFWKQVDYGNCEIDFEFLTNQPWDTDPSLNGSVELTIYGNGGSSTPSYDQPLSFNPTTGFHRYGFLWTATSIEWYADGQPIFGYTDPPTTQIPCSKPGYIMMNTWTGNATWGGGPPTSTATSVYDWVKYWPGITSPPD
jgi:xyloglucan:xyloglucosyl transferase